MRKKFVLLYLIFGIISIARAEFDIIPAYGIKVQSKGLTYKDIFVSCSEMTITGTDVPTGIPFEIMINDPGGFKDSSGTASLSLVWEVTDESGDKLIYPKNLYGNNPLFHINSIKTLAVPVTLENSIKPGRKIIIRVKISDNRNGQFILLEYQAKTVLPSRSGKKAPIRYTYSTTQGMHGISFGLHFNFFEFKGLRGNNFIYRIEKDGQIHFFLRGLDGWKLDAGTANAEAKAIIYNSEGKELRVLKDVMPKEYAKGFPGKKQELEFQFDPGELNADKLYFVRFILTDLNGKQNSLDLVVKVYTN